MNLCSRLLICLGLFVFAGCSLDQDAEEFQIFSYNFDFAESDLGWQPGFSDFPASVVDSAFYELRFHYHEQEISPAVPRAGLMISGNNHSDDLFMFVKNRVDGLAPNADYTVTFQVEFASDARKGEFGIGGSPGESVFLKVGATDVEPKSVIEGDRYTMNIDKGNQAEDGEDMVSIGDISVPAESSGYVAAVRSNAPMVNSSYNKPLVVRTNSRGELWLIVGTDSGFEGTTTLFYTKISAVFSKS